MRPLGYCDHCEEKIADGTRRHVRCPGRQSDNRCPPKKAVTLHVGINPLGELYWWVSRGVHRTLCYADSGEAVEVAALVLNAP